ncbi:hypothetical protein COT97_05275 [Candidatus Falkowbacteria bacterium CG10_big_fil_rev_8_21_14_0_10_39_11]|uniref:Uncharacterized protein n=1 Tax=Candidatus Falkowbacteria bacterium CG10_big_fil_rev_8_21_14_0_10_39_11 TaxID=1974565 RepID=A0A2H0V3H6_9BACT|nr:MAG: hypothetical protein COT97_05275 [Candidatus Falkowbacteria bacterium CG10_big_fil_rev_8_21_14_0_10_39_11]
MSGSDSPFDLIPSLANGGTMSERPVEYDYTEDDFLMVSADENESIMAYLRRHILPILDRIDPHRFIVVREEFCQDNGFGIIRAGELAAIIREEAEAVSMLNHFFYSWPRKVCIVSINVPAWLIEFCAKHQKAFESKAKHLQTFAQRVKKDFGFNLSNTRYEIIYFEDYHCQRVCTTTLASHYNFFYDCMLMHRVAFLQDPHDFVYSPLYIGVRVGQTDYVFPNEQTMYKSADRDKSYKLGNADRVEDLVDARDLDAAAREFHSGITERRRISDQDRKPRRVRPPDRDFAD